MALKSKSISATGSKGHHKFTLTVTENSTNTTNNTSSISWKFTMTDVVSGYDWSYSGTVPVTYTIKVAGSTYTGKIMNYDGDGTVTLKSDSLTIAHSTNGSKSINFSFSVSSISVSYLPGSASNSYSNWALTTIPRASTITTAANKILGNTCSIKWTPKSSNFKYKLEFSIGTYKYTTGFISPKTTNAYTYTGYTIPNNTTLLSQIPKNQTGTMNVVLYSYNAEEKNIGTDDASFTVTVPNTVVPTMGPVTVAVTPIGGRNILLQNKNTITVSVSGCTAGAGSTIKSYRYYCLLGDTVVWDSGETTSTSAILGPFTYFGTFTIKVVVTDQRGRSATNDEHTIRCNGYSPPFFTFSANRDEIPQTTEIVEEDGTVIEKITSYLYNINCSYSVNNFIGDVDEDGEDDNKLTVNLYYQPVGGEKQILSSNTYTTIKDDEKFTAVKKDVHGDTTYEVWAEMSDLYSTTPILSEKITIYASLRIMNVKSDGTFEGTGIGFGQKANREGFIESAYNIATTERVNNLDVFDGNGYYMTNAYGNLEPAIYRNLNDSGTASNLWIGADRQNGAHFTGGGTYISTGDKSDIYSCKLINGKREYYRILDAENHGKVLYSTSGTYNAGTITLSDSAKNYNYLEIFYCDNTIHGSQYLRTSMRVYNPDGKAISTTIIDPVDGETRLKIKSSYYIISDTTITKKNSTYVSIANNATDVYINGTSSSITPSNHIRITRVLGYQ